MSYPAEQKQRIEAVLKSIANDDPDRASRSNNVGFSAADGPFGHRLVEIGAADWDDNLARGAWDLMHSYRRQAEANGFDIDSIPEPSSEITKDPRRLHRQ
jgi:hypothetical protein